MFGSYRSAIEIIRDLRDEKYRQSHLSIERAALSDAIDALMVAEQREMAAMERYFQSLDEETRGLLLAIEGANENHDQS